MALLCKLEPIVRGSQKAWLIDSDGVDGPQSNCAQVAAQKPGEQNY